MNLRIPNLFKNIKTTITDVFKSKTGSQKASAEAKAELTKTMLMTHGGNGGNPTGKSLRRFRKRKQLTPKDIMHRANFGTFSPVNPNRQY